MIKFIRGLSSNLECKPGKPPKKTTEYQNWKVKGKMATKIIYSNLVTIMIMYTCALCISPVIAQQSTNSDTITGKVL
ncbi:MAG: hypothetical protein WA421_01975 [Nitrososphaeraceae archaeon]